VGWVAKMRSRFDPAPLRAPRPPPSARQASADAQPPPAAKSAAGKQAAAKPAAGKSATG
jgi:hypothetical protein